MGNSIALVALAIAGSVPRGPMNQGWDWPWHDWWQGALQHRWLQRD